MRRLAVVVEGQSESEFVSQVLAPYLERCGVLNQGCVNPILVRTNSNNSRGGMTKYSHLKRDIAGALASKDNELRVTTMIDYFRLPANFPIPSGIHMLHSDGGKADLIEKSMGEDINDYRFIPYIQMHEFEALLFSAKEGFLYCYGELDKRLTSLFKIIDTFPNPEDINSSPSGAPSKRVLAIIPEYQKRTDGTTIILENGIESIISKCPRFRRWIATIIESWND